MAKTEGNAILIQGIPVSQTSPSDDQVLVFDAATGEWTPEAGGGGGTPGGLDTQIQYNNSGSFGGITNLTTDGTDVTLLDAGTLKIGTGGDGQLSSSSDDFLIKNVTQDKDIIFNINDGGVDTEVLRIVGADSSLLINNGGGLTIDQSALTFKKDSAGTFSNGKVWSSASATHTSGFSFTRGRGTESSPAAINSGDQIFSVRAIGYYDASSIYRALEFSGFAAENWDASNRGAYFRWDGTNIGATSRAEWMRLTNSKLGIGVSPNQKLTIEGTMDLKEQASANADTAGYGQIWVKNDTPNTLWFTDDGGTDYQLGVGGSLSFGDAIDGTTGDGISINESVGAVQATGLTQALAIGTNFNTNSAFDFVGASIVVQANAGAGVNTGLSINNASTNFVAQSTRAGSGIAIRQSGVDGVAFYIDGTANVNASTNGLVNVTLNNTQSAASTLCKWDTGTSTQDHLAAHFTGTRFSLQIDNADQAPGTTTNKLYSVAGTLYWDGNDLTAGGGGLSVNTETLTGDKTLVSGTDDSVQHLDPNGANRTITLDVDAASNGDEFWVKNTAAGSTIYRLTVQNETGPTTLQYVMPGNTMKFIFDGTNWLYTGDNDSVVIGKLAQSSGDRNVVIGENANIVSSNDSVCIGFGADVLSTSPQCVAIGRDAQGEGDAGVAIGYQAKSGGGNNSTAVGYLADGISGAAIAIGYNTKSWIDSIAIGQQANCNNFDRSFAIGEYAKAEREGEHVVNIDGSSTQLRSFSTLSWERDTADATPVEIFLRGVTNQRLTVLANSCFTFKIWVTARDNTANHGAGYEFVGVIKRDGANNTAIVGSVAKTVIAEDDAAWDVSVTADDTNEALIITVTGDATNTTRWVARGEITEARF